MRTVYAMPGRCPVELTCSLGDLPGEFELLQWYHEVRDWGEHRGLRLTRGAVISWLGSLVDDFDECSFLAETLELLVEDDVCVCEHVDAEAASAASSPSSSGRRRRSAGSSTSSSGGERPPSMTA